MRHTILCSGKTPDNTEQHYYISLPLIPLLQSDHCINKVYNKAEGKNWSSFLNSSDSALTGFWKTNCINVCLPVQLPVEFFLLDLLEKLYR
jgi:hypothetical protein